MGLSVQKTGLLTERIAVCCQTLCDTNIVWHAQGHTGRNMNKHLPVVYFWRDIGLFGQNIGFFWQRFCCRTPYDTHMVRHEQGSSCYEAATISSLPKKIGIFCKRSLWKRLFSAKETYNFKESTNRSHFITQDTYDFCPSFKRALYSVKRSWRH